MILPVARVKVTPPPSPPRGRHKSIRTLAPPTTRAFERFILWATANNWVMSPFKAEPGDREWRGGAGRAAGVFVTAINCKRSSLEIFTQTQLERHSHSSGSLCGLFFRTSQSPSSQIRVITNHESAQPLMSSRTLSGLMQNNLFASKVILRLSQCHPGTSTSIVRWLLEKKKSGLIPIWMCFRKYSVQPEEEILELWGINKHKNNNIRVCGVIQLTVD